MASEANLPPDYILCLDTSSVPSEAVHCTLCGCDLVRSLTSPKVKPVCMGCLSAIAGEGAR